MLVLLFMPLLTQSNSSPTSELPLLILFCHYPILREALYLCLKFVNYFSRFTTFWTMLFPNELGTWLIFEHMCLILFPGSIVRSGLHSSLFFTVSGMWFLLVRPACMAVLTGLWCRLSSTFLWVCLSFFFLRGVARPGHKLGSISRCRRDLC